MGALQAGLFGLQRPSLDAMLPRLAPRVEMTAANAIHGFALSTGLLLGPAVGGLIITFAGLPSVYAIDVASFGFSLLLLALMKAIPPAEDAGALSLRWIGEGFAYAWSRKDLLGTYLVDMAAMFFGIPIALFPAIAAGYGGASALGFLLSVGYAGNLLTYATSGWTSRVHRHGLAVTAGALIYGGGVVLFGLANSLWLALLFLAVANAGDTISGIFRSTIWNQSVPDHLRGRLASIELLSYSSGPLLGNVESGVVSSLAGVRNAVWSGGLLAMAGAVAVVLALPAFRGYDARKSASGGAGA
ncbi:MAG: MFS transporter [Candidatus Dormibacteraeota bacterium]|uniref:MFS transporter n=1 Tax=Candidatus Dormiibacter inghamiae TaxID=3127013 RepID=A0A934K7W9_9BACT|nr:MFS transporter [Candidatus Dormibacteraeota bacterium]MBJ7606573.1 MFS transporter [Candidatus Dormibacteraeota bacterium]